MNFKKGLKEREVIVKCAADRILPFSLVFGIYVILFGTVSPGGGFQGGVIAASGFTLLYLGYGMKVIRQTVNAEALRLGEAAGAAFYVFLGVIGILLGFNFAKNVFADIGEAGELISAGTITFMSYTVGFKVLTGVGFLLLLMLGMLAAGTEGDAEEETEETDK